MFVLFIVELPTFQCKTTTVSDNKQTVHATYQYCCCDHKMCLVYCFSGKCLMHRTVPVECLGESYFCFALSEIINYVYDCAEEIYSAYVADSIESGRITCEFA
jgi:hypothetical protein